MEDRANVLRAMKICRFCLREDGPLSNIHDKQIVVGGTRQTVPLPLQLMACVAIEVFANDGMPQMICHPCRTQTSQAYTFKTNCKKADDALKVFLATGALVKPWTQDELEEQSKAALQAGSAAKRPIRCVKATPPPKAKRGKSEVITLNYSASGLSHQSTSSALDKDDSASADQFEERHYRGGNHDDDDVDEEEEDDEDDGKLEEDEYVPGRGEEEAGGEEDEDEEETVLNRTLKVNQCDKTFLTGDDLDAHTAKHKKKRPFTCKICSKSFVFKQGLERHVTSHSNVKPHKCNYCEASFTSAIKLTRHVTSHAGLRPYPCKICGRTFLLSHHLTRHMRSHYAAQQPEAFIPPIGQHKCDICSMSFRRKDSLINHSAIHSMVNLKCVICNTEFDNVVKVKEHITTHLSDLPFPCEKCDYSFETQEQLEDHELKHVEMEYEEQIEQEVIAEARQAAAGNVDEEDEDYSGDEIAEFTITNDINNPEVVRRSRRSSKVKNYADFLKDEVDSEVDEKLEGQGEEDEHVMMQDTENDESQSGAEDDVIKPIVRSEGTKVYARKSVGERPKLPQIISQKIAQAPLDPIDQLTATKDLTKLPEKEIFNMKIGDKTVMVQKLLLTKEQMKAMAKEGKIEKKGNTYLLKKSPGQNFQTMNFESLLAKSNANKSQILMKKTYQRHGKALDGSNDSGANSEPNIINSLVFEDTSMDGSVSNV